MTVEDAIVFAEYPEYNYPILVVTLNGVHVKMTSSRPPR